MRRKKIKLSELKVSSFATSVENSDNVKGGRWSIGGRGACPHTGEATLDYLGCNTLDAFFCFTQP